MQLAGKLAMLSVGDGSIVAGEGSRGAPVVRYPLGVPMSCRLVPQCTEGVCSWGCCWLHNGLCVEVKPTHTLPVYFEKVLVRVCLERYLGGGDRWGKSIGLVSLGGIG